mgnify:FL=1
MLLESNYEIRLIDNSREACAYAADNLDVPVIWGDGTSVETIRQGIGDGCDVVIAVTGKDQDNLIACEICQK